MVLSAKKFATGGKPTHGEVLTVIWDVFVSVPEPFAFVAVKDTVYVPAVL